MPFSPFRASNESARHSRRRDSVALSTQGTRFLSPRSLTLTGTKCPALRAPGHQPAPGMDHEDPTLDVEAALREEEEEAYVSPLASAP